MRAIVATGYGDPDVLAVGEVERPEPGHRDLLVEIRAAGVNPVDTKIRRGLNRAIIPLRFPATLGMDVSGVVVAVGAGVTRFRVGDEVVASPSHRRMGGYAEMAAIDEREAALKSPVLSHVEAASLPLVGLTAWDCLVRHGKLEDGMRVFIQAGSGGVGTVAVQLARHLGAEVLTTCSARNVSLVESLGAHRVIDYGSEDYTEIASGVDLALESLGPAHLDRACGIVRRGGRLITISPGLPEAVAKRGPYLGVAAVGMSLLTRKLRYRLGKGVRFKAVTRKPDGQALSTLMDLATAGSIVPVLDSVLPLCDAAEAHRRIESGHRRGKVVLAVA